ncbi:hypothetical protein BN166_250017 [Clostridioides difficile E10]|nr:hypothetical protein BN166_250017 [Clostridioides difficile E10]
MAECRKSSIAGNTPELHQRPQEKGSADP